MNQPIHVAHVIHSLGVGGLENGVVNLVTGSRSGIRHTIVCLTTAGPFGARLARDVDVLALGKTRGHDVRAFGRLVRLLRRLRPNIVHSRNWAAFDAVVAARLARVPIVVHGEHGRDISDPDGLHARRNRLRRLCSPLISRFVAVSADLRRWLIERVRITERKVVHISNGVDTARFTPGSHVTSRVALGFPADDVIVGTVARLDPVKDHAGLIRAFALTLQNHPDATLVIVGDGPCRPDLERLTASLGLDGRVRFLGERRDIAELLQTMDVFVLSSVAEGISNTVLEAMATGLPIVATAVGGNPELVEEGVNGFLVPRTTPAALASALGTYLDDPTLRALHGKSSRQRALDVFDLERMRRAYTALYADLWAARRRSL
jgi:sugar transferase (PEP-CTERM/EpsH1 system associated)